MLIWRACAWVLIWRACMLIDREEDEEEGRQGDGSARFGKGVEDKDEEEGIAPGCGCGFVVLGPGSCRGEGTTFSL